MTPLIKRSLLKAQPQEVGKIKIGGRGAPMKSSGGSAMYVPERFDHFLVTTMVRSNNGKGPFMRDGAVHAIVGDEPTELDGTLMFPDVEQNLMTTMHEYSGRRLKVTCDGEVQKNSMGVEGPCAMAIGGKCNCKPYIRLPIQLNASPHTGGYYLFRSHSWRSTNNIQTFMEETYERFGTLFHAPVKLLCFQTEDQYEVDGKEMTGRSLKVSMVLNLPYEQAALHMVGQKELLEQVRERLMITAGKVTDDLNARDIEEADEIADEFNPPKGVEASVATQGRLDALVASLEPVEAPVGKSEAPDGNTEADGEYTQAIMLEDLRDEARLGNLLDAKAEQAIADALESGDPGELDRAIRALNRLFEKAEEEK